MTQDGNAGGAEQAQLSQEAFVQLHARLKKPIYNFFANRGCSKEKARDLRQETFLQAYRSLESFRDESRPETWLFGIAKNVWLQELRDRDRQKRRGIEISIEGEDDPTARAAMSSLLAAADCPFEDAARAEESRLMRKALQELPAIMRQCVLLWADQELKYREIAKVLQITVSQVKTNLSRARGRLRRIVEHRRAKAR